MLQTTVQGSFSAKLSSSNHPPVKQAYSGEREYLFPRDLSSLVSTENLNGFPLIYLS